MSNSLPVPPGERAAKRARVHNEFVATWAPSNTTERIAFAQALAKAVQAIIDIETACTPELPSSIVGCACRWDADDTRVVTCERHQGWLDVVHEWAERAKAAEVAIEASAQHTKDIEASVKPLRSLVADQLAAFLKQEGFANTPEGLRQLGWIGAAQVALCK